MVVKKFFILCRLFIQHYNKIGYCSKVAAQDRKIALDSYAKILRIYLSQLKTQMQDMTTKHTKDTKKRMHPFRVFRVFRGDFFGLSF